MDWGVRLEPNTAGCTLATRVTYDTECKLRKEVVGTPEAHSKRSGWPHPTVLLTIDTMSANMNVEQSHNIPVEPHHHCKVSPAAVLGMSLRSTMHRYPYCTYFAYTCHPKCALDSACI